MASPGGTGQPSIVELDAARQEKAKELSGVLYTLRGMDLFLSLIYMVFLLFSGVSAFLRDLLPYPSWLAAAVMGILFLLGYSLLSLPLDYYQGKVVPQRFGLSHPGLAGLWATDKLKGIMLAVVFSFLGISVLYLLIGVGGLWWLLASLSFALVSFVITLLLPDLFLRLFYRLEPVKDEDLKQRLMEMSERAGSKVLGVYSLDFSRRGTMANAMLAGQGHTRKILLSDTLMKDYPPEEIEVILAHELGHHKLRHMPKMLASSFLVSLAGFYLVDTVFRRGGILNLLDIQGLSDPAGLPLILAAYAVFLLFTSPLALAYSRHMEKQADAFSLQVTGKAAPFISSENRLTNQNLLKSRPGWLEEVLFLDHPPHYKRVRAAAEYQKSKMKNQR